LEAKSAHDTLPSFETSRSLAALKSCGAIVEMSKMIFSGFGIDIIERGSRLFLRYDAGEIADKIVECEVSEEEAAEAQRSEQAAYQVILKCQARDKPA
jgi:hypothetical protein